MLRWREPGEAERFSDVERSVSDCEVLSSDDEELALGGAAGWTRGIRSKTGAPTYVADEVPSRKGARSSSSIVRVCVSRLDEAPTDCGGDCFVSSRGVIGRISHCMTWTSCNSTDSE